MGGNLKVKKPWMGMAVGIVGIGPGAEQGGL